MSSKKKNIFTRCKILCRRISVPPGKQITVRLRDAEIIAEDVSKGFNALSLFQDLSFALNKGETLAIAGPNGSGKSTLLRIIAGLMKPDKGHVHFFVNKQRLEGKAKQNAIGMTAPGFSLYPDLSVLENLEFLTRIRNAPSCNSNLPVVMKRMGLSKYLNVLYKHCSTGIRQRVKLAQAIVHEPLVLLLDEPGANLDVSGFKVVKEVIKHQQADGITIIASNDRRELDMADHIIDLTSATTGFSAYVNHDGARETATYAATASKL